MKGCRNNRLSLVAEQKITSCIFWRFVYNETTVTGERRISPRSLRVRDVRVPFEPDPANTGEGRHKNKTNRICFSAFAVGGGFFIGWFGEQ